MLFCTKAGGNKDPPITKKAYLTSDKRATSMQMLWLERNVTTEFS